MTIALPLPLPPRGIADDVRRGLTSSPKTLPPHLFYDDAGSRLYELITELPEYYLTRAEREIFEAHSAEIVARATSRASQPLAVVELGAGSATKTEVLLRALLRRQASCLYVPIDVSPAAIELAERRLRVELPATRVRPLVMPHAHALRLLHEVPGPALVLFIGSSIGNLPDDEASSLLGGLRAALGPETSLLLGTDLRKSPATLLPAYDDAAGVTAAFNKNVLFRINRELGGHFDLDRFRHVARWNDGDSRIEMHLESTTSQVIAIDELDLRVRFEAGETIHTESSIKYDLSRVERLLRAGGFRRETTFYDDRGSFGLHLGTDAGV
jgi:L-histidine N-alpha-methyltransferase